MADAFVVHIHLTKLHQNLANSGSEMTLEQLEQWLWDSGLRRRPDGTWLVQAISLSVLDKSEYRTLGRA